MPSCHLFQPPTRLATPNSVTARLPANVWCRYEGLKPALVVASGDTVDVEMVAAGVNACEWEHS